MRLRRPNWNWKRLVVVHCFGPFGMGRREPDASFIWVPFESVVPRLCVQKVARFIGEKNIHIDELNSPKYSQSNGYY